MSGLDDVDGNARDGIDGARLDGHGLAQRNVHAPGRNGSDAGRHDDRFWPRLWRGSAPLFVWALHFFMAYALVAAGCHAGWGNVGAFGVSGLHAALGAVTLAALAITALLLWRAIRRITPDASTSHLTDAAAIGSAVLALIGVAWTTVPMLLIAPCHLT